jgi:hypothetical protein
MNHGPAVLSLTPALDLLAIEFQPLSSLRRAVCCTFSLPQVASAGEAIDALRTLFNACVAQGTYIKLG